MWNVAVLILINHFWGETTHILGLISAVEDVLGQHGRAALRLDFGWRARGWCGMFENRKRIFRPGTRMQGVDLQREAGRRVCENLLMYLWKRK